MLLSADANLWYRLRSPDSYDGMGVRRYEQLQEDLALLPTALRGSRTLEVLGIRYIAAEQGVFPTALPAARPSVAPTFTALLNRLHAITVDTAEPPPGTENCQVTLELVDTESGAVAATSSAPCRKPYTTLSFPPIADSVSHEYTARFGGPVAVVAYAPWALGTSDLVQVDGNDKVALFRAPSSPARYFSPAEGRPVADDDEARRILASPEFAMARTVLIDDDDGDVVATSGTPGTSRSSSRRRPRSCSG